MTQRDSRFGFACSLRAHRVGRDVRVRSRSSAWLTKSRWGGRARIRRVVDRWGSRRRYSLRRAGPDSESARLTSSGAESAALPRTVDRKAPMRRQWSRVPGSAHPRLPSVRTTVRAGAGVRTAPNDVRDLRSMSCRCPVDAARCRAMPRHAARCRAMHSAHVRRSATWFDGACVPKRIFCRRRKLKIGIGGRPRSAFQPRLTR
jgi:hypothetical protein